MNSKRVFVVGLDGATFDLIGPWMEGGELPNLARMMQKSSHGRLESTIPPISPPAWASFMTGVNPGKHGIYDFIAFRPNSFEKILVNSSTIRSKRFWDLAGERGKRSMVLYIPLTFPPRSVKGVMISGIPVPPQGDFIYPKEMGKELEEKIGTWWMEVGSEKIRNSNERVFLDGIYQSLETRFRVTNYLMTKDWDFFIVVFMETDLIQHLLWSEKERCLLPLYRRIDEMIGHFLRNLREEDVVIVLSDHGAGPVRKTLYLNTWLKEKGFLASKRQFIGENQGSESEFIHDRRKASLFQRVRHGLRRGREVIHWGKTRAYFFNTGQLQGIGINLKGREPGGIVSEEEYDEVRNQVIRELQDMVDEREGKRVIERVFRREEIYHGPYVRYAPDIVFIPNYEYMISERIRGSIFKERRDGQGVHRLHGIFIGQGPGIRKGKTIDQVSIMDMAPTILYLLGLPVPKDFDGKVLVDALEPDLLEASPILYDETASRVEVDEFEMTEGEVEEVKKRLRALNYIE